MRKTLQLGTIFAILFSTTAKAQLFKVELTEKANASSLIAEGKVIAKKSFWNDAHTMIFTANTIQLYKTFKGNSGGTTIEILTQGGSVGNRSVDVSELLTLSKNQIGLFFCFENKVNLKSPTTGKLLLEVYGSDQGFLRYDLITNKAYAPFAEYNDIEGNFYKPIQQLTGQAVNVIDASFSVAATVKKHATGIHITNGTQQLISSFSPAVVHGGTLNDPLNNTLTINGSGFGSTPSGSCAVNFKDGNSAATTPSYAVAYNSPYLVSWTDTRIVVNVPSRAATGAFSVVLSNDTALTSPTNLTVDFSVLNAEFDFSSVGVDTVTVSEPRLMNANNLGGYTYQFSNSTAGKGINFAADGASTTFLSAATTWRQLVGAALTQGSSTATQMVKDDDINVIEYDNTNTGVPVMAAGVLEATYSWFETCYATNPFVAANSQKTGFDILVRNPSVSSGSTISFQNGPCFPDINSYDLESIILHEIGHVLDLAHINDGYQQNPYGTTDINPGKVMHYAIVNYADRRSPDNSAYTGALYTVTPQGDNYGVCGLNNYEMAQGSYTIISNDECPGSFPTTTPAPGTLVNFDLVHATSNANRDPAYTQVNCQNNGTSVTNNAYYALKTADINNGTLTLTVSNYSTTPAGEANCTGQGVRLAVYQVSSCPGGQAFPQPINCATFTGNGALPNITGLLPNQTYLLYLDGLRNTKANFNIALTGSALPIVLSKFSGAYVKGVNDLYIQILQAINVQSIVIEKSADGYTFSQLGELQVTPTELVGTHTFVDAQPLAGDNFYRLRIVDNDGNFQYSDVVLIKNPASQLVYIYPNPVKDNLLVSLSGMQPGRYNFEIFDVSGKTLVKNATPVNGGSQTVSIPLQGVATGVYLIKITNAKGAVISEQKVLKQ